MDSDLSRVEVYPAEDVLYRERLSAIRSTVTGRFLQQAAREKRMAVEEYISQYVTPGIVVTDEGLRMEVREFTDRMHRHPRIKNLSRDERESRILEMLKLDPNRDFHASIRGHVRRGLAKRREREAIWELVQEAGLRIYLREPIPPYYPIAVEGCPVQGPDTCAVTVVVFSDFQCPYSARAAEALKRLVKEYPGEVRVVFRNFPLRTHGQAQLAAEAAAAAHEQGLFWEYHDVLFANQAQIGPEHLKRYARSVGLDMDQFGKALSTRKHEAWIRADTEEGLRVGVQGTPAIYVNGQPRRPRDGGYFSGIAPYIEEHVRGKAPVGDDIGEGRPGVLAEVGNIRVTEEDLDRDALYKHEEQLYQIKLELVQVLLEEHLVRLAAGERGIPADSLFLHELGSTPSAREMEVQYGVFEEYVSGNPRLMMLKEEERRAEILRLLDLTPDPSRSYEDLVMAKLRGVVKRQNVERLKPALVARLMTDFGGKIHLDAPRPPVHEIRTQGYPSLGPAESPATVVVFSDFECPHSAGAARTLGELVAKYPGRARVIFRNFPLPMHRNALSAHEAGECAREQGEFWGYHDLLFANQTKLDRRSLSQYAAELQLDLDRFDQCLDSGRYANRLRRDTEEGRGHGVRGTPTVFINGVRRSYRTVGQLAWLVSDGEVGEPVPSGRKPDAGNAMCQ